MRRNTHITHSADTQGCPQALLPSLRLTRPHLRSVLSAREMAGFLTALLHAALLLQERLESAPPPEAAEGFPWQVLPQGGSTPPCPVLRRHKMPLDQGIRSHTLDQILKD